MIQVCPGQQSRSSQGHLKISGQYYLKGKANVKVKVTSRSYFKVKVNSKSEVKVIDGGHISRSNVKVILRSKSRLMLKVTSSSKD